MDQTPHVDIGSDIPPTNAMRVYGDAGNEEFPVLKAFQQYIDAEQNKARKRMIALSIFFAFLMTVVIVVFLVILNHASARNQALNDRLINYMMKKDADRQAAVVVQPQADHSAVLNLASKIDEMQRKMDDANKKAEAEALARQEAEKKEAARMESEKASRLALEKAKLNEEIEIARLKAELAAEREKASRARETKREAELEAYRRKYYPELYETKTPATTTKRPATTTQKTSARKTTSATSREAEEAAIDALLDELSKDEPDYFEEDEAATTEEDPYTIPVEVKGVRSNWRIP